VDHTGGLRVALPKDPAVASAAKRERMTVIRFITHGGREGSRARDFRLGRDAAGYARTSNLLSTFHFALSTYLPYLPAHSLRRKATATASGSFDILSGGHGGRHRPLRLLAGRRGRTDQRCRRAGGQGWRRQGIRMGLDLTHSTRPPVFHEL